MVGKFSERLKELRVEMGLTQESLSKALNYTQSNICEWERGAVEPKLSAILCIAKFFHVSVDFLIGMSEDPEMSLWITPVQQFSSEEHELLELYRRMDRSIRVQFLAYGEGLLGAREIKNKT